MRLYCFLRLNLNTRILSPRSCAEIVALTRAAPAPSPVSRSPPSLKSGHHFAERDFRADFGGQFGNADHVARSDAKLLSAGLDNCMHLEMNLDWKLMRTLQRLSTLPKL